MKSVAKDKKTENDRGDNLPLILSIGPKPVRMKTRTIKSGPKLDKAVEKELVLAIKEGLFNKDIRVKFDSEPSKKEIKP